MKELVTLLGEENVRIKEEMSKHTTFRIGGPADVYVKPPSQQALIQTLVFCKERQIPCMVMGNGSNMLVSDAGIAGVVVSTDALTRIEVNGGFVTAQSGAMLSKVASEALRHALSGLEFAAGIPGTIGGGVFMNAGAYGGELKDVVTSVTAWNESGIQTFSAAECRFLYRSSIFQQNHFIILDVTMELSPGNPAEIESLIQCYNSRRKEKQPLEFPSAGSTFKRPEGHFAGQLIEMAGLKGCRIGGAMVSEKHSGFVINAGGATAADVTALVRHIKETVYETSGVRLEEEIKVIGRI